MTTAVAVLFLHQEMFVQRWELTDFLVWGYFSPRGHKLNENNHALSAAPPHPPSLRRFRALKYLLRL